MMEGRQLGHPRKEEMEPQTQQERRPGHRVLTARFGSTDSGQRKKGGWERDWQTKRNTKRWTGKSTVAGDKQTAEKYRQLHVPRRRT